MSNLNGHHANGKKWSKTAAHFTALEGWKTVTQPLTSNWIKEKDNISTNAKLATLDTKRLRITRHSEVWNELSIWCSQAVAEKVYLGF
ncbi:expressed protein [Phakopsora pachyrhizi]|uniref:Expressed protein n=1 Tax=Phakopsora pachyrhizi TaxID=170000 RepID=A0AAV0B0L9_PHAPC|nr:expressed protein [Phakopsora pachyrhizi]